MSVKSYCNIWYLSILQCSSALLISFMAVSHCHIDIMEFTIIVYTMFNILCKCRAYSDKVAKQNKDKSGKKYRIVPLGVELRPAFHADVSWWTINHLHPGTFSSKFPWLPKLTVTQLRFLLPKDQVRSCISR